MTFTCTLVPLALLLAAPVGAYAGLLSAALFGSAHREGSKALAAAKLGSTIAN